MAKKKKAAAPNRKPAKKKAAKPSYTVQWCPPKRKLPKAVEAIKAKGDSGKTLTTKELDLLTIHSEPMRSLAETENDCEWNQFNEVTEYIAQCDELISQLQAGKAAAALTTAKTLNARMRRTQDTLSELLAEYENLYPED